MTTEAEEVVRARLKGHARQGVFQGLAETPGRLGKHTFSFRWLLNHEFRLELDPRKEELVAKDLLPSIENRSFLDKDLRRFIAGRTDAALPEHRRLDTDVAHLVYQNRKRVVSLVMRVHDQRYEQAIKSLLGVLNDLFTHLHLYHVEYLQTQFGLPEE